MVKRLLWTLGLVVAITAIAYGGQPKGTAQLGLRLGLFKNDKTEFVIPDSPIRLFANTSNFYIEGFVNYYATSYLALVLNLGSYSKGDIRFDVYYNGVFDGSFLGQATIIPMQAGLKLSPFSEELPLNAQPYVEGGWALIVGREQATTGTYYSYFAQYTDGSLNSETDFDWWAGGGVEIPLSSTIQFDFMAKYINTKFSGDIAGIRDFSGLQISFGVSYLKLPKKSEGRPHGK